MVVDGSGKSESVGNTSEKQSAPRYEADQNRILYNRFFPEGSSEILRNKIIVVGKHLGSGSYSDVWLGELVGTRRKVAIKVDKRDPLDNNQWEAVRQKVTSLQKLNHQNIAKLLDYIPDFENRRSYLIMEYADGKALSQELKDRGRPFPQGRVLDWAMQILYAMEYLHKNKRVAGNISPSNIVLGRRDHVTLVDFSYISEITDEERAKEAAEAREKGEQDEFGRHVDPEQFQTSVYKDIYHLGATLFELLTGKEFRPYSGKENRASARKLLEGQDTVKPNVADVILKATSPVREERYPSAKDMEAALRELPRTDKRSLRQTKRIAWTVVAAVLALLFGSRFYITGQAQISRKAEINEWTARSSRTLADGDYSEALASALSATERGRFDPPVPVNAYAALANAVSAYDYVPGYKPLYSSSSLRGNPRSARLSPNERYIAILVDVADAYPASNRIQILETKTGKEVSGLPVLQSKSIFDFLFLENNDLVYVTESQLVCCHLGESRETKWDSWDETDDVVLRLSLSEDGKRLALVNMTAQTASLFSSYEGVGTPLGSFSIADEKQPEPTKMQSGYRSLVENHMCALNRDGSWLAVSLLGGGVRVLSTDGKIGNTVLERSNYRNFEGGFTGSFFFYAASDRPNHNGNTSAECKLYDLNEFPGEGTVVETAADTEADVEDDASGWQPVLDLEENRMIHVQADKDGIYLSIGSELYRVNTQDEKWEHLVDTGAEIQLMCHNAGRLLAMTESNLVLVYRENGAWKTEVSSGRAYTIADLSNTYLFLASPSRALLSVLEWRARGELLLEYSPENDPEKLLTTENRPENYYEHLDAHVHADGKSAMLFSSQDFRIYSMDGTYQSYPLLNPSGGGGLPMLYYQRIPFYEGDPQEECLKAVWDNTVQFFSSKTGELLQERGRNENEAVFDTGSYHVQQSGGMIEIYTAKNDWKMTIGDGILTYASEMDGQLILSLHSSGKEKYSLLFDKKLNEIGSLPQPCEALPEGQEGGFLVFDDTQGHLLKGTLLSLGELRDQSA